MCATYFGDLRFALPVNLGSPRTPFVMEHAGLTNCTQVSVSQYQSPRKSSMPALLSNLRSINTSPVKQQQQQQQRGVGSQSEVGLASPSAGSSSGHPRREPHARKSSIWDSFFQYDIEYQGKASKK